MFSAAGAQPTKTQGNILDLFENSRFSRNQFHLLPQPGCNRISETTRRIFFISFQQCNLSKLTTRPLVYSRGGVNQEQEGRDFRGGFARELRRVRRGAWGRKEAAEQSSVALTEASPPIRAGLQMWPPMFRAFPLHNKRFYATLPACVKGSVNVPSFPSGLEFLMYAENLAKMSIPAVFESGCLAPSLMYLKTGNVQMKNKNISKKCSRLCSRSV